MYTEGSAPGKPLGAQTMAMWSAFSGVPPVQYRKQFVALILPAHNLTVAIRGNRLKNFESYMQPDMEFMTDARTLSV